MKIKNFDFKFHNVLFFGQYWQPKKVKAIVIILHGLGEHLGRYEHVAKKLCTNYFGVLIFDNFGHGKTKGKRGHNPGYNHVINCIDKLIEQAKNIFNEKPIFLYGHSMGGNVVLNYVLRKSNNIRGVIATSPFLKLAFSPPAWKLFLAKIVQKIAPSLTLGNEIDPNDISRDSVEVKNYIEDPLVHNKVSSNFSLSFINSGSWAIANASTLKTPVFLLHGTEDKIIHFKGSEAFANNTEKASLKLYEGGYHELHNDLCKDQVLSDIINWLKSKI
ncbi:MAG: lysophospholipase [Tenacibaculum sp.]